MKLSDTLRWLAITAATISSTPAVNAQPLLEVLDEAILNDLIEAYITHEPTTCTSAASTNATSFSHNWPGQSTASNWHSSFRGYEQGLFQTVMSHTDTAGSKSWSIRIGQGGNMYSHFAPDMHGETMPPQKHDHAPWIDEVQQSVSVNLDLNKKVGSAYCSASSDDNNVCKKYYIHQAGTYTDDGSYTSTPFYSPSLAKHCSGNSCIFASWGQQAHVKTPFTSAILYINKYTNCDNGIIEHTQMIHNFANPASGLSSHADHDWFNVGWGGVRSSSLPYALEANKWSGHLEYNNVNAIPTVPLCRWGQDDIKELKDLRGYTTFVEPRLLVNSTNPAPIKTWCRKPSDPTCSNEATCMQASCTDAQVANQGYVRVPLRVGPNQHPGCREQQKWNGYSLLMCNMRPKNFGQSTPYLQGGEECAPWTDIGFYNTRTGQGIHVAYVKHWSWKKDDYKVYFAVYETDATKAINLVNSVFDNRGHSGNLYIDIRSTTDIPSVPLDYNPASFNTFTYVYGNGAEYGGVDLPGKIRRRVGATEMGVATRDYSPFTVNWYSTGAVLRGGDTYANRGYYFVSDLGSVQSTAEGLRTQTFADKIGMELWTPRTVDIYESNGKFIVKAADAAGGTLTDCGGNRGATIACSGSSTPQSGKIAFFYMTCEASTYFGPNPYELSPAWTGNPFPGHASDLNRVVRAYACDGLSSATRPTWKLMGFFNPNDAGCAALSTATYEDALCTPSESPTSSPTASPTISESPTFSPSKSPTKIPTTSPTTVPTASPEAFIPASSSSLQYIPNSYSCNCASA